MSVGSGVLLVLALCGFIAMIAGTFYSNYAVQEMRTILNQERAADDKLKWYDAIQYVAQDVIDPYREAFPNGSQSRKLKMSYYVAGVGGAVMIVSAFLMKFVN